SSVGRDSTDHTCVHDLLSTENLVSLQDDVQLGAGIDRSFGDLFDLDANRRSRHEEHRLCERPEGPLATGLAEAGDVVDRLVLQLASGRAVDHAVLEIDAAEPPDQ